jgi:hypothetical protein
MLLHTCTCSSCCYSSYWELRPHLKKEKKEARAPPKIKIEIEIKRKLDDQNNTTSNNIQSRRGREKKIETEREKNT